MIGIRARRRLLTAASVAVGAAAALWASFFVVPLPERLAEDDSPVVAWRDGTPAHVFLAPDERWRMRVEVDEVDPAYVQALLRVEDKRFYLHPGVDPVAIGRAAALNARRGRVVSGGSTLTMQVVRVLEPRPRTLVSKVIESWRALQLEVRLTKSEILSAYLTYTPYGKNIEGVETASWAYFGHSSKNLNAAEIATLLAVPQAPTRRHPNVENGERLRVARDEIAVFLAAEGALPLGDGATRWTADEAVDWVRAQPVPVGLASFPRDIPEVARWLRGRRPDQERIVTTLDRGAQRTVERHLHARREGWAHQGIAQGAAVVVDHHTGEVVAMVGSLNPWGTAPGDQVAMFDVPRSPGSALKPFLYARAIDRGLALPEHLVRDVPASYHGYAPRNYDGEYDGLVTLEASLSRSLNLPFVFLLQEVGVEDFLGVLRGAGVESLRPDPGYYGLSVAAGGIEMTPIEVTGLYTSLAAGEGGYRPLRFVDPGGDTAAEVPLFSDGAAWLTRRALQIKDRPDFPGRGDLGGVPVGIHWKTGTSFGHRDAWACGSGPRHTACIWLGNADMTPSRYLVGAEAAGAPLFDVLEALGPRGAARWEDPVPPDLTRVEVDAWSGYLPTPATPATRSVWALRDRVPPAIDPFHVRLEVDLATGEAVTPACRGGRRVEEKTFVVLPGDVRRWLSDQKRGLPQAPRFADGCRPPGKVAGPRIVSPADGEIRKLVPGLPASAQEVALEADSSWSGTLSWFVDGGWLGEAPSDGRLWWTPTPGRHEVVVRDGAGRSSSVVVVVEVGVSSLARR